MRLFTVCALAALVGCGADVDLGGGGDAAIDAAQCGDLVSPSASAGCKACGVTSTDCQPNGCYGGYWCDLVTVDCQKPPATCP